MIEKKAGREINEKHRLDKEMRKTDREIIEKTDIKKTEVDRQREK